MSSLCAENDARGSCVLDRGHGGPHQSIQTEYMIGNLIAAKAHYRVLLEAARAFINKLDEIQPHIASAFAFKQLHGQTYDGPNYGEELLALREALDPKKCKHCGCPLDPHTVEESGEPLPGCLQHDTEACGFVCPGWEAVSEVIDVMSQERLDRIEAAQILQAEKRRCTACGGPIKAVKSIRNPDGSGEGSLICQNEECGNVRHIIFQMLKNSFVRL